jgi:hypothetical protein
MVTTMGGAQVNGTGCMEEIVNVLQRVRRSGASEGERKSTDERDSQSGITSGDPSPQMLSSTQAYSSTVCPQEEGV